MRQIELPWHHCAGRDGNVGLQISHIIKVTAATLQNKNYAHVSETACPEGSFSCNLTVCHARDSNFGLHIISHLDLSCNAYASRDGNIAQNGTGMTWLLSHNASANRAQRQSLHPSVPKHACKQTLLLA